MDGYRIVSKSHRQHREMVCREQDDNEGSGVSGSGAAVCPKGVWKRSV